MTKISPSAFKPAIVIFVKDHEPPHVHVFADGGEILVEIETGRVMRRRGALKKSSEARALRWLAANRDFAWATWHRIHEE